MWKTLMVLALSGAGTALACDLDDCDLAISAHLERSGAGWVPEDRWNWMNHDLALARSWLAEDPTQTRQIVATLDAAMRAQVDDLVRARGAERAALMHEALDLLMAQAGGPDLRPLAIDEPKPRKSRLRLAQRLGNQDEPDPEAFVGEPDDDEEAIARAERDRERDRERERERQRDLSRLDRDERQPPREPEVLQTGLDRDLRP